MVIVKELDNILALVDEHQHIFERVVDRIRRFGAARLLGFCRTENVLDKEV
jgi:hypothetical protein